MSRDQVSDYSTFGQAAVAAKCLKVHRRAGEIPANLPRTNLYCQLPAARAHAGVRQQCNHRRTKRAITRASTPAPHHLRIDPTMHHDGVGRPASWISMASESGLERCAWAGSFDDRALRRQRTRTDDGDDRACCRQRDLRRHGSAHQETARNPRAGGGRTERVSRPAARGPTAILRGRPVSGILRITRNSRALVQPGEVFLGNRSRGVDGDVGSKVGVPHRGSPSRLA